MAELSSTGSLHARRIIGRIITHLITICICFFFLFPFYIMITTSLKADAETARYPVTLIPDSWVNFTAYEKVFETIPFFQYLTNTLFVTLMSVLGVVLSCPIVAYSLSRIHWKGRDQLFIVTLAVMMIPYSSIMIPIFLIYRNLNLVGTFVPLFLSQFFGAPYYIFLLRQFFKGLPGDLEDSGRIDGCSEFMIFLRIFMPLCLPAIVTIMVMQLLNSWNDFTGPLIYLQKSTMYTMSIGLQQFKEAHKTNWPQLTAAASMMSLPLIVIFFFAQKQFMEGITFSGIKG